MTAWGRQRTLGIFYRMGQNPYFKDLLSANNIRLLFTLLLNGQDLICSLQES